MLCAQETSEENIIKILKDGELGGETIKSKLKELGIIVSSQAVYKILKKLREQEVVLKNRTKYSLNYVWLKRLQTFASHKIDSFGFQNLEEGDKITYQFNDLGKACSFWMHVFQVLFDKPDVRVAIAYSPNEWTFIVREDQDFEWASTVSSNKDKITLFVLGENNLHNKKYKASHNKNKLRINVGKDYGFSAGYYFNVFNDYVVEMIIPNNTAENMSKIFEDNQNNSKIKESLFKAGIFNSKSKLIIKRNKKLSQKLYRKIAQDFYLPKKLRKL